MGRPRGHLTSLQLCSALRGGAAGELQRKPEPWKQGVIPAERMDELRRQKESEVRTGYPSVEIEDQEFISRRAAGYRALEYSKAMIAGDGGAARMEAVLAAMRAGNASLFDVRHEMNEICLEAQEGRIQPPGNCAFQLALQACELAAQQAAPRKRTAPRQPSTEPPDPPPGQRNMPPDVRGIDLHHGNARLLADARDLRGARAAPRRRAPPPAAPCLPATCPARGEGRGVST
jgi:hypothetical protein